jgi:hypothetical protein
MEYWICFLSIYTYAYAITTVLEAVGRSNYLSKKKTHKLLRIMFSHAECQIAALHCTLCSSVILFCAVCSLKYVQLMSNKMPLT